MRPKPLPTAAPALLKMLDDARAWHVHLNERHENYVEIVRYQHHRIADARETATRPRWTPSWRSSRWTRPTRTIAGMTPHSTTSSHTWTCPSTGRTTNQPREPGR